MAFVAIVLAPSEVLGLDRKTAMLIVGGIGTLAIALCARGFAKAQKLAVDGKGRSLAGLAIGTAVVVVCYLGFAPISFLDSCEPFPVIDTQSSHPRRSRD